MTHSKKLLAFILAFAFLFSAATLVASANAIGTAQKGDINQSGDIDMMDYVLTKRAYFGTFNFSQVQNEISDINNSNTLDMMDYILIKRMYFGTFKLPESPEVNNDYSSDTLVKVGYSINNSDLRGKSTSVNYGKDGTVKVSFFKNGEYTFNNINGKIVSTDMHAYFVDDGFGTIMYTAPALMTFTPDNKLVYTKYTKECDIYEEAAPVYLEVKNQIIEIGNIKEIDYKYLNSTLVIYCDDKTYYCRSTDVSDSNGKYYISAKELPADVKILNPSLNESTNKFFEFWYNNPTDTSIFTISFGIGIDAQPVYGTPYSLPNGYTVADIKKVDMSTGKMAMLFNDNSFYIVDMEYNGSTIINSFNKNVEISNLAANGHLVDFRNINTSMGLALVVMLDDGSLYEVR